jgi:SAM-dependent methyltransferase
LGKGTGPRSPSMLDLVRLSPRRLFPPGGQDLYRQIARLTDLSQGLDLLDVACGKGIALEYFVREYKVHGTGVEEDPQLVAQTEAHFKESGLAKEASFQRASPSDLPFRDESFDVVVGEVGLAANADPGEVIRELVRVARSGGRVVLVQLVWQAPVDDLRKRVLSDHLGARPLMVVELRRILMDAGVGGLHTEDWIDVDTAFRSKASKPFPDFAELFGVGEKVGILRRARKRWGWRGVWTVFQREIEVHRLLTKERILGLNLLIGVKTGPARDGSAKKGEALDGDLQASGLPLFGPEGNEGD